MSIDYGTDWFKVGLVKPGIPFDIVLNAESKRKTQSAMTIRGNNRAFGSEAISLATRFPQDSFIGLKRILGRDYDDSYCAEFRNTFTNKMLKDEVRGTAVFETTAGNKYSVEELVAMQLALAKQQAEETAGETIKDVVLSIPPYFSQFERQALLDAAELAGLHVLSLIHDESAVALNYAMTRSFPQEQCHIFYDMGAGSTVASVACFQDLSVKDVGKFNKTVQQVEIKAVGYDRTLGGHDVDVRLQKFLAEKFQEQSGSKISVPVVQNERAMAKLLKEANRVKQILSANTETMASVENLTDEIDFRIKVTRAELEEISKDLFIRVRGPIDAALAESNMKLADIQSLVLVGGGVRVPAVQANLAAVVGEEKIAKNVNGDEAAVMGAVFRAASLSRQFKVKEVRLKDVSLLPIEVKYTGEAKDAATPGKLFLTPIFNKNSVLGTRKTMSFKRVTDFSFDLEYGQVSNEHEAELTSKQIAHVSLSGLTEAINKFKDVSVTTPTVKVTIELSDSGLLGVGEAVASIETDNSKKASLADKVKSFFGGSDKNGDVKDAEPKDNGDEQEGKDDQEQGDGKDTSDKNEDKTESNNNSSTDPSAKNETVVTTQIEKVVLKVQTEYRGIAPLSDSEMKESLNKIQKLDALDAAKRAREEARNALESFLYRGRELLYKDEIIEVSTEEQRKELSDMLSTVSEWLDDNEDAETNEFQTRLKELRKIERPLSVRAAEHVSRPKAFASLTSSVTMARTVGEQLLSGEGAFHDPADVQKLFDACDDVLAWIKKKEAEQAALPLWQDGVVTTREIQLRGSVVEREMHRLMTMKRPKVVKKKEDEKVNTTESEDEKNNQSSKAEEGVKENETRPLEEKDLEGNQEDQGEKEQEKSEEPIDSVKHPKDEL
ncbi:Hsp70 protein-domain-containing protein [Lobosporangium transversale]|uniref:Hsp70 protein-domain-containing protein n=1 Tax=Lobosporangium transversale TaxID=64571 RepID=A0A1Y2H1G2_9FUNG|nr:Hsp70 protein-domain-containing protein [Lobosporangium transversale]ORZ27841.1 Hsp70 protein-domain-containing protein [Lobosporangium transversale]|eukprot:XP_021885544.1 Hsp70 protein-domain-containing protein [Lobosporangium transversale]